MCEFHYEVSTTSLDLLRITTHYALRTMAKTVTPEVIEAIVTRVMEKFTDVLSAITTNLTAMIRDTFNTQLTILNARLDAIEGKIAQNGSTGGYRGDSAPFYCCCRSAGF